jgi:hypothetical protein
MANGFRFPERKTVTIVLLEMRFSSGAEGLEDSLRGKWPQGGFDTSREPRVTGRPGWCMRIVSLLDFASQPWRLRQMLWQIRINYDESCLSVERQMIPVRASLLEFPPLQNAGFSLAD